MLSELQKHGIARRLAKCQAEKGILLCYICCSWSRAQTRFLKEGNMQRHGRGLRMHPRISGLWPPAVLTCEKY